MVCVVEQSGTGDAGNAAYRCNPLISTGWPVGRALASPPPASMSLSFNLVRFSDLFFLALQPGVVYQISLESAEILLAVLGITAREVSSLSSCHSGGACGGGDWQPLRPAC